MGRALPSPAALALLAAPAGAQAFVDDVAAVPSGAPANSSYTEQVDLGDVDLDGDWDAVFADGGDAGKDQNRIWIDQGGLQARVRGTFLDETDARLPAVLDASRDVELADIDGDGDLDLYASNTSQLYNHADRWWINAGGMQGGELGYFVDETAERWVGIGGPGSSVATMLVLPDGFIDWTGDSDFADLDADGDLDLVHSAYGGGFSGQVPTRLFLNDGAGYFSEWNPSGWQLTGTALPDGAPGLWCDGVQAHGTTDATGAECDVAVGCLDVDVGDLDGDLDLDLLLDDLASAPRAFANRLEGSALAPAAGEPRFRDVSALVVPPLLPSSHAADVNVDLADLDGDGDLDVLGTNWLNDPWYDDLVLGNEGGILAPPQKLPQSGADDSEAGVIDYDADGDLDVFVASFSGVDRLYRSTAAGFELTAGELPALAGLPLDADVADLDGDGDYDLMEALQSSQPNRLLRNLTDVPDLVAPRVPLVEAVDGSAPGAAPLRVRAQVVDNAPLSVVWYHDVRLEVTVDGVALPALPATSMRGQLFRAELPGNLAGAVAYRVLATDDHGNTGASAPEGYDAVPAAPFALPYGAGTSGRAGGEPEVRALSVPLSWTTAYLAAASGAPDGTPTLLAVATEAQAPPAPLPGLLVLHVAGAPLVLAPGALEDGAAVTAVPLPSVPAGLSVFAQAFVLDPTAGGDAWASSGGLEIVLP